MFKGGSQLHGWAVSSRGYEPRRTFSAVAERDPDTGLYVGSVPGFPGAHSHGNTLGALRANLQEVIAMPLEDGEPRLGAQFVGVRTVAVE